MKKKMVGKLSMIGFFAVTIAMVMDIYEYPIFATSGLQLIFFLLAGGLLWFIPAALCSAEMATVDGWEEGGIYTWVKNTLGERWGFIAIFFQWFQVTVGFITMLYFILSAFTYVLGIPEIDSNPLFKFLGIMIIFWGLTASQLGGTKRTELFGKIGTIVGIMFPAVILFILSLSYIVSGNPVGFTVTPQAFIPNFTQPATLVVFISFILSYMGVEASASYVNDLENPKKNYPLAMLLVVLAAIILNAVGGLSIAAVVPASQLSLSGGIIQALETLFEHFGSNLGWAVKVVSLMIALGVAAEVTGWVVGPSRGLYTAAKDGLLPRMFRKENKKGVPVPLVILQGTIVTIWAAVLTFFGGGNNLAFTVAISVTVVIYLVAYFLFFIGYFVLAFKKRNLKRTYEVPGGVVGKVIVASIGLVTSVFCFIISFVPPSTIAKGDIFTYESILIGGFLISVALPVIIYRLNQKQKKKEGSMK